MNQHKKYPKNNQVLRNISVFHFGNIYEYCPLPVTISLLVYFPYTPAAEFVRDKRQIHGIMRILFARVKYWTTED